MSTETEVKAKQSGNNHVVTVGYDFGDNLNEAVELFGEDVIFAKFKQAAIVDFQSILRRHMFTVDGEGDSVTLTAIDSEDVALIEAVADWKPGVSTRVTKSPKEKAMAALKGMSPEEIEQMLAELDVSLDSEDDSEDGLERL